METIGNIGIYVPAGKADVAIERGFSLARRTGALVTYLAPPEAHGEFAAPSAERAVLLPEASAKAIRSAIESEAIDFLVKAALPAKGSGRIVGGIARELLRDCPCPLWITRSSAGATHSPVIAAVGRVEDADSDDVASAKRVISTAAYLSACQGRPLVVAHAWSAVGEPLVTRLGRRERQRYLLDHRRWLYGKLAKLTRRSTDTPALIELVQGSPSTAISELAESLDSDTIVVGHRGRRGLRAMLFGNTGEELIDSTTSGVVSVLAS